MTERALDILARVPRRFVSALGGCAALLVLSLRTASVVCPSLGVSWLSFIARFNRGKSLGEMSPMVLDFVLPFDFDKGSLKSIRHESRRFCKDNNSFAASSERYIKILCSGITTAYVLSVKN